MTPRVLRYFKENRVISFAIPAHSSHKMQPLDVGMFGPFKSVIQQTFHASARRVKKIGVLAALECVASAFSRTINSHNIKQGFAKSGVSVPSAGVPSLEPLRDLISNRNGALPTVDELRSLMTKRDRAFIFDADIVEEGTIKVSTTRGANLCAEVVIDVLERRHAKSTLKEGYVPHVPGSGPTPFAKNVARRQKRIREKEAPLTAEEIAASKVRR